MIKAVICDDEGAAISIIKHYIEDENPLIEIAGTAANGLESLNLIKKEKPDLAFMDVEMPYMNGLEVIERALKDFAGLKVIIITAYDSFQYAQQALRLGAVDIISKPIDFAQLGKAISRAIGWDFTESSTVNIILEYVQKNYPQEIRLPDLAQLTFCTESHISREFKKHVGMTIITYVHKVRIGKAAAILRNEDITIQEVASMVGYQNINNFYKYFKQYMGMTPAAYVNDF